MKTKPPTPAQVRILLRLVEGWHLAQSTTYAGGCWLQRDGIGKGGPAEVANAGTVNALWSNGLLRCSRDDFPVRELVLTKAGREAARAALRRDAPLQGGDGATGTVRDPACREEPQT